MSNIKLKEVATIKLSNVDKRVAPDESSVSLCNFVDIYKNWAITRELSLSFMNATANLNEIEKFSLKKGQVAITKDSETRDDIGISAYIADTLENTLLGYHCALISPCQNQLNGQFLNAFLHSSMAKKYFSNQASGSGQRYTLTLESISNLSIPYFDLKIQKSIANFFSNLDKKISLNNRIITKLEEMAKTIYDYWFLQFDFPNDEGKPYASSGGAMKYSKELGRNIPLDWEIESFESNRLFEVIKTGVEKFQTKRYLATADVEERNITKGKEIEYETREGRANMQPTINSVWFAKMKNSIKHLFLNQEMSYLIDNTILSTGFFGLQCSEVSFEYIASVISNPNFEVKKDSLAHGATQQAINQNDLKYIKLVIPNEQILEKYHFLTKPIYGYISKMKQENEKLAELRDWLLPMLMNGQVRVE